MNWVIEAKATELTEADYVGLKKIVPSNAL
jgi:hypothetical protein